MPKAPYTDGQQQVEGAHFLLSLNTPDALGVVAAYLLYIQELEPEMLRRVMNEKVVKNGFTGVSLLETINRVCK